MEPTNVTPTKNLRIFWIPVVAAFLRKENRVLVGRRPKGSLEDRWEFPGGKIESGESPEQALKRELKEEIGIEARQFQLLWSCSETYGQTGIIILFYSVDYWKGEPKPLHHTEIRWIPFDDLPQYEMPEINQSHVRQLMSLLKYNRIDG